MGGVMSDAYSQAADDRDEDEEAEKMYGHLSDSDFIDELDETRETYYRARDVLMHIKSRLAILEAENRRRTRA